VGAFDELDEEEDSDSIRFFAHPETIRVSHKGYMRRQVRTYSSFSRRVISVLEKLIGWPPGNLVMKSKV